MGRRKRGQKHRPNREQRSTPGSISFTHQDDGLLLAVVGVGVSIFAASLAYLLPLPLWFAVILLLLSFGLIIPSSWVLATRKRYLRARWLILAGELILYLLPVVVRVDQIHADADAELKSRAIALAGQMNQYALEKGAIEPPMTDPDTEGNIQAMRERFNAHIRFDNEMAGEFNERFGPDIAAIIYRFKVGGLLVGNEEKETEFWCENAGSSVHLIQRCANKLGAVADRLH